MTARILLPALTTFVSLALAGTPAHAQASRTWVSGVGDDLNPCSRTAPCKTFAGALAKTVPGGEINCLDPGGYGAVTINRSITIDCTGTLGSILAPNTTGIVINGADVVVTLRNLAINGTDTGLVGVRLLNGGSLEMRNVAISGFSTPNGAGVSIEAPGNPNVYLDNIAVSRNSTGIRVLAASAPRMMLVSSVLTGNTNSGLSVDGAAAQVRVGNSTITGNGTGVQPANGARILTYGDNRLDGNAANGQFTLPGIPRH